MRLLVQDARHGRVLDPDLHLLHSPTPFSSHASFPSSWSQRRQIRCVVRRWAEDGTHWTISFPGPPLVRLEVMILKLIADRRVPSPIHFCILPVTIRCLLFARHLLRLHHSCPPSRPAVRHRPPRTICIAHIKQAGRGCATRAGQWQDVRALHLPCL